MPAVVPHHASTPLLPASTAYMPSTRHPCPRKIKSPSPLNARVTSQPLLRSTLAPPFHAAFNSHHSYSEALPWARRWVQGAGKSACGPCILLHEASLWTPPRKRKPPRFSTESSSCLPCTQPQFSESRCL